MLLPKLTIEVCRCDLTAFKQASVAKKRLQLVTLLIVSVSRAFQGYLFYVVDCFVSQLSRSVY